MILDWEKLKVFYHVANAGSITTAAQRLHISQPALSRNVLNLEERIGHKLFKRHKKGITLTRQGEILYRGAQKMHAESRNIEDLLKEGKDKVEGELKITTTPGLASTWLMRQLPTFIERYPDLRLKIVGQLEDGEINSSDVWIRPYIPMQPTLIQKHLTRLHMRLFASRAYIEKFGIPQSPEDLDHHRLITFGGNTAHSLGNINWILNIGLKNGASREPFLEVNSSHGLLRAAELGLGIVELGKGYPQLEGVDLIEILPNIKGPVVDLFYIYPEHKNGVKKIMALHEMMVEHLKTKTDSNEEFIKNNQLSLLG